MNQQVKTKWLNALRSGEYTKGLHALKSTHDRKTQWCCLGVLCDIYSKEKNIPWKSSGTSFYKIHSNDIDLSPEVMEWAELGESNPNTSISGYSLMYYNDDLFRNDTDFNNIADIIEKEL